RSRTRRGAFPLRGSYDARHCRSATKARRHEVKDSLLRCLCVFVAAREAGRDGALRAIHWKAMSSTLSAFNGHRRIPAPVNEPNRTYAPGTPERASLKARLKSMAGEKIVMPLIIGGKEVKTGSCGQSVMPHDHGHVLGEYHKASEQHVLMAVEAAQAARRE